MKAILKEMTRAPLFVLWLASACAGGGAESNRTAERDSAGIAIVDNSPPYPEWRLDGAAELRIGVAEGDAAYQLHDVRFAARLSDGRIVLIDGGASEIRWYSASGEHRSSVGRRGAGPGEFLGIRSAILTDGDTLVVHDAQNQRITWLSPAETIARDESVPGFVAGELSLLGTRSSGRTLVSDSRPTFQFGSEFNYSRDTLTILAYSAVGTDTVRQVPGSEAATWVRYTNGRPTATMQMEIPFGYVTLAAATSQWIVVANGEQHQLEMMDEAGRVVRLVRRGDHTPRLPSSADRDAFIEHMEEQARRRGVLDPAIAGQAARDRLALLPGSHTVPSFDRLMVDADDRIWVRDFVAARSDGQAEAWSVHDASGRVLARVILPAGFAIMHIASNHVTGVERDDVDVQSVVVYRIERETS